MVEVIPTNDHFRESSASPILEEDSQAEELVMEAQGMYITSISNNCVSHSFKPYHTLTGDKYKFPSLFINQFFPRPGTPAAKMKRIPTQEVKERTKQITELFRSYHPYSERLGQTYTVLCTETSHDGNYYVAHNQFYEQILVPKRSELMGKMFQVKIVDFCKFSILL